MRSLRRLALLPALLLLALAAGGCNDDSPSESPAPTPTPPPRTTETFSGTFTQNGSASHEFTVAQAGDVELKLTAMAPLATLAVGMGIGRVDTTNTPPSAIALILGLGRRDVAGGACEINTTAVLREGSVSSFGLRAGEYCVVVFDNGLLPEESRLEYTLLAEFTD